MPRQKRVAGTIEVKVNGDLLRAVGDFSWNLGKPKREMKVGSTGADGYAEMPQVAFIEGVIRHTANTNIAALCDLVDATITLTLANTQVYVLRDAIYAGEGTGHTEEGTFDVRFEGISADLQRNAS